MRQAHGGSVVDFTGRTVVVAYGAGVDSTAMLVGFVRRGIVPLEILFADVGAEKPSTYAYIPTMSDYLVSHGLPPVRVVRYVPKRAKYRTLEQECLQQAKLPALAYGRKQCSIKWKHAPQHKYLQGIPHIRAIWSIGEKLVRAIGYDNSPCDIRRVKNFACDKYENWYPLQEWGWDRERCKAEIAAEGLPVPPKSSCFFCPAMKPEEIHELADTYPGLLRRLVVLEDNAQPNLRVIEGLWRKTRKRDNRPGSIAEYVRRHGLMPKEEVELELVGAGVDCGVWPGS
jgi:hypothetical protein